MTGANRPARTPDPELVERHIPSFLGGPSARSSSFDKLKMRIAGAGLPRRQSPHGAPNLLMELLRMAETEPHARFFSAPAMLSSAAFSVGRAVEMFMRIWP